LKNQLNNHHLKREIGLFSATVLVVANMVGTGVFTTSGFIMAEVASPGALLLCWFVGGVFALCGALCYGELGAMFPKAGGEYVFLRESFGKPVGFVSGWISLIVGFSAPIAAASIAFATYCFRLIPQVDGWGDHPPVVRSRYCDDIPGDGVGAGHNRCLFADSLPQRVSRNAGSERFDAVQDRAHRCLCGSGLWLGAGSKEHFFGAFSMGAVFQKEFAVSLIFVSFAYSGWNAAAYLGGEIKNPSRNIPWSLLIGTLLVMGFYLLLNVVYVYALPAQEMKGVLEVGAKSAVFLFGDHASRFFTGAIALGLLSVLSAMIMAGPRVYYAMARDGVFFERLGKVNKSHNTPAYAILLQAGLAMIMVLTASFDMLLIYIGFTLSLCATLTVAGMILLRVRHPGLKLGPVQA
jgi:basic amino acid/polyamine antiporter, APA family